MSTHVLVKTVEQMREIIAEIKNSTGENTANDWRRADWRLTYAAPTTIETKSNPVVTEPIHATTRDISASGMCFLSRAKLVTGQKITVAVETEMGTIEVPATVVHITPTVGMFKVGVSFDLLSSEGRGNPFGR